MNIAFRYSYGMDLKTYLQAQGIRQTDFAGRLLCSQAMISQIITGKRRPSPDLALRISRATGGQVSVMELLFGAGQQAAA